MPLGALAGGVLGSALGVRETMLIAAIGGMFPWLSVYLSPLRTMKELPSYVAEPTDSSEPETDTSEPQAVPT
jgi:hypothetical protein